ncbi:glutathione S-transferase N-terminal domain-containing protein [Parvularcula sp. IMCC14364]|uniref:glutathione S-transferase N-terminal domain-containing protein n=1 Tax=Parvularcula sp. IMCC14364 TaxID=3067902 RepID=UPI00274102E2|nr:glutathione S-transferase N-terminal domain-containing protein [Parvularcula sp. IMCC14364]
MENMTVYGSKISYYTWKLETYLRLRRIPYLLLPTTAGPLKRLKEKTGTTQMPVVRLGDERWMTDTTPMLAWLETQFEGRSIYPADPVLNAIALLIEDYADEWLWRPAMHYRWSFRQSRQYAAEVLYEELIRGHLPMPRPIGINYLKHRQLTGFVWGDGVTRQTRACLSPL